jgi:hypothetical protein
MTTTRIQTLAILMFFFAAACAKSNTRLGREEDSDAESIYEGGAFSDANVTSDSASPSDSGRPAERDEAEDSGEDSALSVVSIEAGVDGSFSTDNIPPSSVLVSEENPEIREARLDLISQYCSLLEKFPCLDSYYSDYEFDSMEERVRYCEQHLELEHYQFVSDPSGGSCESEWENVLECAVEYDYSCPCPEEECILAHSNRFPNTPYPCKDEVDARFVCENSAFANQYRQFEVTGERFSCTGHLRPDDEATCIVVCPNDETDGYSDYYRLECGGPLEGPFDCVCTLNLHPLYDAYAFFGSDPIPDDLVPDCESATKMMADGKCHDITDCCFTFLNDEGEEECGCTADVTQSTTGAETCEELAVALGGEVVDLCPQYVEFSDVTTPPR